MIIDTHTHFYDPSRDQGVPWPPKDQEVLYRTVLPHHFKEIVRPLGVTGTVVVEASSWVTDNHWILDLAAREPAIVGFVGNIDLRSSDCEFYLKRFSCNELFRGVRARDFPVAELLDETAEAGLSTLADLDLSLDLLAHPDDLSAVDKLAGKFPSLRIVLDHVVHVPIDGKEPAAVWVNGIRKAAAHENVCCKVSRLTEAAVTQPAPSDPGYYAPTLKELWRTFGTNRLMYGSNWPVCEVASDYQTGLAVVQSFLENRPESERDDVMWRTAKSIYKWVDRTEQGE